MSDILKFTLLGAGYFCFPLDMLEFCSGMRLGYLERVSSSMSCCWDVRWDWSSGQSGAIFPHFWGQDLSMNSTQSWDFHLTGDMSEMKASWLDRISFLVNTDIVPSDPFRWLFPQLEIASSQASAHHYLRRTLCISSEPSLRFFLLHTLTHKLQPPCPPWTLSSISSTQRVRCVLPGFPLLGLQPEDSPKAVNWGNHGVHFVYVMSF